MAYLPRGIAPELLHSQVKNTMPYLFEERVSHLPLGQFYPARILREFDPSAGKSLSHFEYFRLCLSSHYLTCATPVPTDVDNQIRRKLWPAELPLETALEMVILVIESRHWDFRVVSNRYTYGAPGTPWENQVLGGHLGEWFTVACGAYCALNQYQDSTVHTLRQHLFEEIADEVHRHSEIFGSLWRAQKGLACLKTSANIAHNLGDLDRVMDMWDLSVADPLRLQFYKLGVNPFDSNRKLRYLGRLWVAGEIYKETIAGSSMAFENHRHFALRKPKCLRQDPAFLVPNGPFFDDWGRRVAKGLASSEGKPTENTLEVVEALKRGWERLPKTVGYGRALRGILEVHPELDLSDLKGLPQSRSVIELSQDRFEKRWNDEAIKQMDDIPSRA